MSRLLPVLMLPLLIWPTLANAAQWTKVGAAGAGAAFIDKGSILKNGKQWKVWSLVSYPTEQATEDGTAYRSTKALHLYSCAERTTVLQSQLFYGEPMGRGAVVQSFKYEKFNPEDIVPDSVADSALKVICKRK